jgi:predicted HTH transcriptional regulator
MFETNDELLKQIKLGEDSVLELKNLEYKGNRVSAPHRDSMADELAAMANTANSVIILGVEDKTKSIIGIPENKLDMVETWLRGICNDLITPQLFCRIRKISVSAGGSDRIIIRVDIPKSLYVHQSPGGYFHRIGSSKRQMPSEVLARLFQQRSQVRLIRFDEQSVATASRDCLEKPLWKKFRTHLSPPLKTRRITGLTVMRAGSLSAVLLWISGAKHELKICPAYFRGRSRVRGIGIGAYFVSKSLGYRGAADHNLDLVP